MRLLKYIIAKNMFKISLASANPSLGEWDLNPQGMIGDSIMYQTN